MRFNNGTNNLNIMIPTIKEMKNVKNDLLSQFKNKKINIKELVDKVFDAGYAFCFKTYLADSSNK